MIEKKSLSQLSDEEVEAIYLTQGSFAKAAAKVGCGPTTFKDRYALIHNQDYQEGKGKKEAISFLMEELEARGIDPRDVTIKHAKVSTLKKRYQSFHKDQEGNAVVTPLKSDARTIDIVFSPKFEDGPKWPVIAPATPIIRSRFPQTKPTDSVNRRVFLVPDVQIGFYRNVVSMELTPFHDLGAMDICLQMLKDSNSTEVVILGDLLDLPSLSRWLQLPEFQLTLQPSLDVAYQFLSDIRDIVGPDAPITYLAGNHERRLSEYIATNAKAAYGIRRAMETSKEWPVLSVPSLLHLYDLDISYSDEYPSGVHWLTDKLAVTHQPPLRTTDIRATIIHGHVPKAMVSSRSVHYRHGIEEYDTVAIPGLMRIDDVAEPMQLGRSSVPSNSCRANWQQGVGAVDIFPGGEFDIQVYRIKSGKGIMDGSLYEPRKVQL